MQILRQSTQIIVRVGPFVDVGDGFTPQTDITLGGDEAELLKNASVEVDISGRTWAAVTNCRGWYDLTLTTSDTDTVGLLTVVVQDDSDCLPVFRDFQVVEEAVFDELYKISAVGIENAVLDAALTAADHNVANSLGKRIRQLAHTSVIREEEQARAGSASTITLHTDASGIDGFYDDAQVIIVDGLGVGQPRHIHAYNGTSGVASITPDWITTPDNTSKYVIRADSEKHVHEIDNNAVSAAAIADGAIDNATFAADVGSTAYASNIIALAVRKVLDEINIDHLMKTAVASNSDMTPEVPDGTVMSNIMSKTSDTSTYVVADDSQQGIAEGVGVSEAELLAILVALDTDVATSDSTTSFTLTAGKASDNAYNGMLISVTDADDSNTETRRIEDYTSSRVVTVDRAFSFTPAVSDVVRIWAMPYDKLAAVAGGSANTYIVTDDGTSGGTPIADVHVWVTVDSAGARLVASGTTDTNGEVIFYLDAGTTYYVWMAKNGYNFSDTGESWLAT